MSSEFSFLQSHLTASSESFLPIAMPTKGSSLGSAKLSDSQVITGYA